MNVLTIRRATGLNQQQFWSAIGVTQSGGSRYENGRRIPKPVQTLVNAVYVHQIDLSKLNGTNAPVVRAVLAGELDTNALQETANTAKELMAQAQSLSLCASDLSAKVRCVTTEGATA